MIEFFSSHGWSIAVESPVSSLRRMASRVMCKMLIFLCEYVNQIIRLEFIIEKKIVLLVKINDSRVTNPLGQV